MAGLSVPERAGNWPGSLLQRDRMLASQPRLSTLETICASRAENDVKWILRSARSLHNPPQGETMMTKRMLILVMAMGMSMALANSVLAIPLPQSQDQSMQSNDHRKNDHMKDHKMAGEHMKSHDKMAMHSKKDQMKHDKMSHQDKMDHPQQ
jgi:hypothetical protein